MSGRLHTRVDADAELAYGVLVRHVAELADGGRPVTCLREPLAWTGDQTSEEEQGDGGAPVPLPGPSPDAVSSLLRRGQGGVGVWSGDDRTPKPKSKTSTGALAADAVAELESASEVVGAVAA